jgi:hypothetical protein
MTLLFPPPPPPLSESFKGRSYGQLTYGMKPSLDKELYPPFWAVKLYERLLQRFLRLVHGMQGVRKQIALLLRAVFTKVPASLCQLCKTHLALKKLLSFSHDQLAFIVAQFVVILFNRHLILGGFKVDPCSRCSDYPSSMSLLQAACSPSCILWSANVPPP